MEHGFSRHGLSATFTLFPDTTNWYHGLLWELNNHFHPTDKSSVLPSQRMDVYSVHRHWSRLHKSIYECCSEITETITFLSIGLNLIQNNFQSHQVQHIWGLGLNYLTASVNGYDPVAFLRLITPLHRSASHYVDVHCTVS